MSQYARVSRVLKPVGFNEAMNDRRVVMIGFHPPIPMAGLPTPLDRAPGEPVTPPP